MRTIDVKYFALMSYSMPLSMNLYIGIRFSNSEKLLHKLMINTKKNYLQLKCVLNQ